MQTKITKQVTQPQQFNFKVGHHQGQVIIVFPDKVKDISFVPGQARQLAELLLEHADHAEGNIILPVGMTREESPDKGGNGA